MASNLFHGTRFLSAPSYAHVVCAWARSLRYEAGGPARELISRCEMSISLILWGYAAPGGSCATVLTFVRDFHPLCKNSM